MSFWQFRFALFCKCIFYRLGDVKYHLITPDSDDYLCIETIDDLVVGGGDLGV